MLASPPYFVFPANGAPQGRRRRRDWKRGRGVMKARMGREGTVPAVRLSPS
jgi:hypothetical protein